MTEKYKKENYVHLEENWKRYMPNVLLNHYKQYFKGVVGDFGCNTGLFDLHFAQFSEVEKVVGYDVNLEAIEQAKKFAENSPVANKVLFLHQNLAENIPHVEYFDFVICFHILEHIFPEDVDNVIHNIHKSLKPGGHALLNLPDKHSYAWEPAHVYHPNKEELNLAFEGRGFTTVEAYEDERGEQVGPSRNITALYRK